MKDLIQRYIQGAATEEEKLKFMKWIEESQKNKREYLTIRKLYDISLWTTTKSKNNSIYFFNWKNLIKESLKVAAILAIVFTITQKFIYKETIKDNSIQSINVPAGQRAELTLSDGTHVWLNSRSTLKLSSSFNTNNREVELEGEGYFTVSHDKEKPFIVKTSQYNIRVLGTEFNVNAYNNNSYFETSLLKGCVEISSPLIKDKIKLNPNQALIAKDRTLTIKQLNDHSYFKWKDGIFCFNNETVENLIDKLQLYYDIKIDIHKQTLLKHRYSGKFRIKDGIEHVLKVLQLKHKFTYTKDEDKNLIIIK